MQRYKFIFWVLSCLALLASCGGTNTSEPQDMQVEISESEIRKEAYLLPYQDTACTLDKAVSHLGEEVLVWLYEDEKPIQKALNMRAFSGQGITSTLIKKVTVGAKGERVSDSSTLLRYSEGLPLAICRANGGYELDSLENSGLLLAYIVHETMHLNRRLDKAAHKTPMQIYLQPLFIKRSNGSVFMDNAMHVGGQSELFFFPHSHSYLWRRGTQKIPYNHNWIAIGHEITHNLFHDLVLVGKKTHTLPIFVTALDEAIADLVGHLHWYQPHFILSKARDVSCPITDNLQLKRIELKTIRELENGNLDPHMMGAYLAHGFYQLIQLGIPKNNRNLQMRFVFQYLHNLQMVEWKESGPDFLLQALQIFGLQLVAEQGYLYAAQCEAIRDAFPILETSDNSLWRVLGCAL